MLTKILKIKKTQNLDISHNTSDKNIFMLNKYYEKSYSITKSRKNTIYVNQFLDLI
jgi:hypothetical protein